MSSELLCKGDECELPFCEVGGPLFPVKGCDLGEPCLTEGKARQNEGGSPEVYLRVMNHSKRNLQN